MSFYYTRSIFVKLLELARMATSFQLNTGIGHIFHEDETFTQGKLPVIQWQRLQQVVPLYL
jgi:hypothetical protein